MGDVFVEGETWMLVRSAWSVPLYASLTGTAVSLSLAFVLPNFIHLTGMEFKAVILISFPVNRERQVSLEELHFFLCLH